MCWRRCIASQIRKCDDSKTEANNWTTTTTRVRLERRTHNLAHSLPHTTHRVKNGENFINEQRPGRGGRAECCTEKIILQVTLIIFWRFKMKWERNEKAPVQTWRIVNENELQMMSGWGWIYFFFESLNLWRKRSKKNRFKDQQLPARAEQTSAHGNTEKLQKECAKFGEDNFSIIFHLTSIARLGVCRVGRLHRWEDSEALLNQVHNNKSNRQNN